MLPNFEVDSGAGPSEEDAGPCLSVDFDACNEIQHDSSYECQGRHARTEPMRLDGFERTGLLASSS